MTSFARRCVQAAFGAASIGTKIIGARKTETLVGDTGVVIDGRRSSGRDQQRAIVSHAASQAKCLAEFMDECASECSGLLVPSVYDDASNETVAVIPDTAKSFPVAVAVVRYTSFCPAVELHVTASFCVSLYLAKKVFSTERGKILKWRVSE